MKYVVFLTFVSCLIFGSLQVYGQEKILGKIQQELTEMIDNVRPGIVLVECHQKRMASDKITQRLKRVYCVIKEGNDKKVSAHVNCPDIPSKDFDNLCLDTGVGFILDKEGYILTSDFVKDASNIEVIMSNGKKVTASIKGIDEKTHAALLKIDTTEEIHPIILGDSDQAKPGNFIITYGNPYGMGLYISLGIIGGAPRYVKGQMMLPMSVPVHPGDRGGLMFNLKGEIIGIVDGVVSFPEDEPLTQKFNLKLKSLPESIGKKVEVHIEKLKDKIEKETKKFEKNFIIEENEEGKEGNKFFIEEDGGEKGKSKIFVRAFPFSSDFPSPLYSDRGIGLAFPINTLKPVITALKAGGKVERGWLGVRVSPVPPAIRAQLVQLGDRYALQIEDVLTDSPAAKAGLKKWDVITSFAGNSFTTLESFQELVERNIGAVPIEIIRESKEIKLSVNIEAKN